MTSERGYSTPEEYRTAISVALNNESLRGAQRAAAEGHARFPDDAELERLNRLLTLRPARSIPDGPRNPDRTQAFQWLEEHGEAYRGQWIALGDKGILAASSDFNELYRTLEDMSPDVLPLVLHLD
jgi:hypothetical protein